MVLRGGSTAFFFFFETWDGPNLENQTGLHAAETVMVTLLRLQKAFMAGQRHKHPGNGVKVYD